MRSTRKEVVRGSGERTNGKDTNPGRRKSKRQAKEVKLPAKKHSPIRRRKKHSNIEKPCIEVRGQKLYQGDTFIAAGRARREYKVQLLTQKTVIVKRADQEEGYKYTKKYFTSFLKLMGLEIKK